MFEKGIYFIAPTYKHMPHKLPIFIHSLLNQTDNRWKAMIIHDGLPEDDTYNYLSKINRKYPQIDFRISPKRANQYGHNLREEGIKFIDLEWVHITNGDNIYFPAFVELMLKSTSENIDLVLANAVHNYAHGTTYGLLDAHPVTNFCDFVNFIARSSLVKEIGFPYRNFAADGSFVEEIAKRSKFSAKIPNILAVHC